MAEQTPAISDLEHRLTQETNELEKLFNSSAAQVTLARITEDFFVRVFLPYFVGDHPLMYPVTMDMWVKIAHSPYNEVIVVDQYDQELYKVPAMFDPNSFKPLDGTREDKNMPTIFDMMQTAQLLGKQGPVPMMNYFNNEMRRRDFIFVDSDAQESINARWRDILARYGRAVPTSPDVKTNNGSTIPEDFDSSEFDPL